MSRTILVLALAAASVFANVGCATKKYVRNTVTPINNKIGELDEISRELARPVLLTRKPQQLAMPLRRPTSRRPKSEQD